MGPYKDDGSVWSACEVDACNGAYVDTDDDGVEEYVYVTTIFHPYTVSCFSRGNWPTFTASCTKNPRSCTGSTSGHITTFSYILALAFIAFGLLFQ